MNTFPAALLSFTAFVFVTIVALLGVDSAVTVWCYSLGVIHSAWLGESELGGFAVRSLALGAIVGWVVFRGVRGGMSPDATFHLSFFMGLALLSGCLWLVLKAMSIEEAAAEGWPYFGAELHVDFPAFTRTPLTCLVFIPVSLFLLSFSVVYDLVRRSDRSS